MKRFQLFDVIALFFMLWVCIACSSENDIIENPQGPAEAQGKPVIGIAWRPDNNDAFYQYWETTIRNAGGYPVHLKQVKFQENWYSDYDVIAPIYETQEGMLIADCATQLWKESWNHSNSTEVMQGIDAVFFPGGEDISTTLFVKPEQMLVNEGFSPTRDVSDFLLMSYCLDKDVPIFCICRGAQMLATVSGATLIQDIPLYCKELGVENNDIHRMPIGTPNRTFTRHDIEITDSESHIAKIIGPDKLQDVPSWHHQAIRNVEGTPLKVTAQHTSADGLTIIEAVERPDKRYAVGVQFHPEYV